MSQPGKVPYPRPLHIEERGGKFFIIDTETGTIHHRTFRFTMSGPATRAFESYDLAYWQLCTMWVPPEDSAGILAREYLESFNWSRVAYDSWPYELAVHHQGGLSFARYMIERMAK